VRIVHSSKLAFFPIRNMWSPANMASLPTPNDLKNAKEAIIDTEIQLGDAISMLQEAQRRINFLKKDLLERKA